MQTFIIDCRGIKTEDEFWQRYIDVTNPEGRRYFGRNLDAFWDAVEGGGPGWPGECELTFTNVDALRALGRPFLKEFENIARDATQTKIELI